MFYALLNKVVFITEIHSPVLSVQLWLTHGHFRVWLVQHDALLCVCYVFCSENGDDQCKHFFVFSLTPQVLKPDCLIHTSPVYHRVDL